MSYPEDDEYMHMMCAEDLSKGDDDIGREKKAEAIRAELDKLKELKSYQVELEQLRAESAELKQELITRVGELQTISEEKVALKANINRVHSTLCDVHQSLIKDVYTQHPLREIMEDALTETPTQSLHDHDMALAEKVRDAVYRTGLCSSDIYDDDNLDITAIVRGEGGEE